MAYLDRLELIIWPEVCITKYSDFSAEDDSILESDEYIDLLLAQANAVDQALALSGEANAHRAFLEQITGFAVVLRQQIYPDVSPNSLRDLVIGRLGAYGFCLANGMNETTVKDRVVDGLMGVADLDEIDGLVSYMEEAFIAPKHYVGSIRFHQVGMIGHIMLDKADHVPMASLALAVGTVVNRQISLWPAENLRSANKAKRARLYRRITENSLKEHDIIFYAPSENGADGLDESTRFAVAHELAHILLGHRLSGDNPIPRDEMEANYLASLLIRWRGIPEIRKELTIPELKEVLERSDTLTREEIQMILARIKALEFFKTHCCGDDMAETAKKAIKYCRTKPVFRSSIEQAIACSLDVALTAR